MLTTLKGFIKCISEPSVFVLSSRLSAVQVIRIVRNYYNLHQQFFVDSVHPCAQPFSSTTVVLQLAFQ